MTPDHFKNEMKNIVDLFKRHPKRARKKAKILMLQALRMNGYLEGVEIYEKMTTK
jgi:sRNA-binding regulator protein Hfq